MLALTQTLNSSLKRLSMASCCTEKKNSANSCAVEGRGLGLGVKGSRLRGLGFKA